jgi:hypothetical protein
LTEVPEQAPSPSAPVLSVVSSAIESLYQQVGLADAAPTEAQSAEAARIEKDETNVMQGWNELKTRDLPRLNQQLKGAGRPEIRPELAPQSKPTEGDED